MMRCDCPEAQRSGGMEKTILIQPRDFNFLDDPVVPGFVICAHCGRVLRGQVPPALGNLIEWPSL